MNKTKVAFICVHNSCRSQMAEALGNFLYGDRLECYSAGAMLKSQINGDAVRIIKALYGIDMDANGHHSKLIDEIPEPDIAISMGCNVICMVYTNERDNYASDAVFANFRVMSGGQLADNLFYRAASPCDNQYNRATYSSALCGDAGIAYVLDLADSEEDALVLPWAD